MRKNYQLIRSKRKSLALQVVGAGELVVRAPERMPVRAIEAFIAEKQAWIEAAQARQQQRAQQAQQQWQEGARIPYLGKPLTLISDAGVQKVHREAGHLVIPKVPLELRQALVYQWYRENARPIFATAMATHFPYFERLGYQLPKLHIKLMKTRWGSLSTRGNMSLNLLLMQYPPQCLHSVVVHEFCHLVHMNHSNAFYALLSERYPQWRAADALLKQGALR